jgi:hypothetical protein
MSDIDVHDHFFRSLLGDPEKARLFLQEVLPQDLQGELDLARLTFDKESHVKADLRSRYSDLVIPHGCEAGADSTSDGTQVCADAGVGC